MVTKPDQAIEKIWALLEDIPDPEVPVISIVDLGIVRDVQLSDLEVSIIITPTYSGCPAMDFIERDIRQKIAESPYTLGEIKTVLSPAWTTDWLSEQGRNKLEAYGIAPPQRSKDKNSLFLDAKTIPCPHCKSTDTQLVSQFGSTACKALYTCKTCLEPFDYFKCL
ncbi:MAG: 1,2-phenylacetyl-CoA epoxidase subunit PaaD [Flavobacteriales bacterium]